jgi:hypothetical protein
MSFSNRKKNKLSEKCNFILFKLFAEIVYLPFLFFFLYSKVVAVNELITL